MSCAPSWVKIADPPSWPGCARPDELMTAPRLGAMKATRLSFANVLARRMIEQRWTIRRER